MRESQAEFSALMFWCVVSGGQGGNTATTNAFPSPYGVIVTLRGGGTFIL